jgi:cytochrome c-type biogenesis protein CcmH
MLSRASALKFICLILMLFGVSLLASGAGAQAPEPGAVSDDQVNAIAKQLYCPVCENIPLDVCGTQACAQWRELIRQKLGEGRSEAEIKAYFVAQYGDRVLAAPPARGLNWLVYVIPPLAILVGVYILYRALKAWKQPSSQGGQIESVAAPSDEYVARIEEELRKR